MTELLKYIELTKESRGEATLTVQLSGGGALITVATKMPARKVIMLLRELAEMLERGIDEREQA